MQKLGVRNGCLIKEDAKVWSKKRLLDEEDAKVWSKNWLLDERCGS
jgi:hypothetical protein